MESNETEVIEQPETDSTESKPEEQPSEASSRYGFLKTEDDFKEKETKEEPVKEEEKAEEAEVVKEEKKEEVIEESKKPVLKYADDKILFENGDDKQELVKVEFEPGKFGYVSSEFQAGYLKNKDYTQKTQALSERERNIEERQKALSAREYAILLGSEVPKPKEPNIDDYITSGGKYYEKYSNDDDAREAYKAALKAYTEGTSDEMKQYAKYSKDKEDLDKLKSQASTKTLEMIESFKSKYGEEEAEKVIAEAQKYINPFVVEGIAPYPEDALEIVRKGMIYDEEIKKMKDEMDAKVKAEVAKKIKELKSESKPENKGQQPVTEPVDDNIPSRYGNWLKRT